MNKIFAVSGLLFSMNALAADQGSAPIASAENAQISGAFDIIQAAVKTNGHHTPTFSQQLQDNAGGIKPDATGKLQGSQAAAYVWPASIESAAAGFPAAQGILALAVTAHPDFDDTPLYSMPGKIN